MAKPPPSPPTAPNGTDGAPPHCPARTGVAASADEEKEATAYYERCREFIVHEDDLIHQRLTWFITLQGFLFGAYGFSMSAQANSLTAEGLKGSPTPSALEAYQAFASNLTAIRFGLIYLGILTAFSASLGIIAAFRAIRSTARTMRAFPTHSMAGRPLYPVPIGRLLSNIMGMLCGLLVPLLAAGIWIWIGGLSPAWWAGVAILSALSAITVFLRVQVEFE